MLPYPNSALRVVLHKWQAILKKHTSDKHSSLFYHNVIDEEKTYNIDR
jgi:hypothetical protein